MGLLLALDGIPLVEEDAGPIGLHLESLSSIVLEMVGLECERMPLGWMAGKVELLTISDLSIQ